METIKVYVNHTQDAEGKVVEGRQVVEAELLEDRAKTVIVKLSDGNIIKRKKSTQVYK